MRLIIFIFSLWILSVCGNFTSAESGPDIMVVANIDGKILQLSKSQVRSLFMGVATGHQLTVVTLPPSSLSRVKFNTQVIGLTEDRIQSYWAQMRFSGRRTPPKEIADEKSLLAYIAQTPGSVGYLSADTPIPETLSVVYQTH